MRQFTPADCPLQALSRAIGGKWKISILGYLAQEPAMRPGELRRAIGDVSEKVLTEQLKELISAGLVERTDYREIPPRVEYSLSTRGRELSSLLGPLADWSAGNLVAG